MHRYPIDFTSRRRLLQAGAALAFASQFRPPPARAAKTGEYRLTVAVARGALLGAKRPETDVWA
jgi:uncharacterized protein (DUF1501 family)